MGLQHIAALPLIALLALTACHKTEPVPRAPLPPAPAPVSPPTPTAPEVDPIYGHLLHAQPKLPTIKVLLGNQELTAEIATRRVEIATGMMYRTSMPEHEAMLFIFPRPEPRRFYMRNCVVPLSAAYISPSGMILQVVDMQPHDESGVPSASSDIQFVLEVPQGWFTRHGISAGTFVRTEHGPLRETFFREVPKPR